MRKEKLIYDSPWATITSLQFNGALAGSFDFNADNTTLENYDAIDLFE